MTKRLLSTILLLTALLSHAAAQYEPLAITASTTPANATAAYHGSWTPFHNPSAMAFSRRDLKDNNIHGSASLLYNNRFAMSELSSFSAATSVKTPLASFGAAFSRFGISAYNENIVGIAVSRMFTRRFAMSVGVDYYYVEQQEIDRYRGNALCEVGLMYEPLENLVIGLHSFNPFMTKIAVNGRNFDISSVYSLGMSYSYDGHVILLGQLDSSGKHDWDWHLGVEWKILSWMSASVGCQGAPFVPDIGLGLMWKDFHLTSRFSRHYALGNTSTCSLSYLF